MADNTKKKNGSFFSRLIYNDKYLAVFSLILAVIVWISVSLSVGTDETKNIKIDVPISISDDLSDQLGMKYYSLKDNVEITVTVKGAKYVVGQVDENDLDVNFDTSNVTKAGQQSIPIQVTNSSKTLDFNVESVYPSSIDGYFDVESSKSFDINLNYDDKVVADGYAWGTPTMSTDKVSVSGPKTYVDKITGVSATVDFDSSKNLKETFTADCDLNIEGNDIEKSYLTMTSKTDNQSIQSISVTLPVVKKVELPVNLKFEDSPSGIKNNSVLSVKYSTDKVTAGLLDGVDIDEAVIGTVSYSQLQAGKNRFEFKSDDFVGFRTIFDNIDSISAAVTVDDTYENQTVYIDKSAVKVTGVPQGYSYNLVFSDFKVTVVAPKDETVLSTDLSYTCDASKLDNGVAVLNVSLSNHDTSWVYGSYKITVELTEN